MAERRRNRVTLNVVRPRKKKNFVIEKVDAPVKVKPADPSRPPLLPPDQIDAETSCRTATAHTADTESESVFTRRKLKAVEAWEELRRSTLRAAVESMCLPDVLCYNCNGKYAVFNVGQRLSFASIAPFHCTRLSACHILLKYGRYIIIILANIIHLPV